MADVQMMIDGQQVDSASGRRLDSDNPFTGRPWATIPQADERDVDLAVGAARSVFENSWRHTPGHERARLMHNLATLIEDNADRLAQLESTDNGKVIRETSTQMRFAARNFRFFAGYADKIYGQTIPLDRPDVLDYTIRLPYGVAAIITAWNSPIALLANKLPPALATGNAIVLKPSEHASVTTCEFAALARDAGFPPGVVNVITGDGSVGDLLTRHRDIDKISFTGGSGTGQRIAANASERLLPLTLELGGKSPNIVFADADLDKAIPGVVAGIFAAAGQTCIAGSRLLVAREIYDDVVNAVAERAAAVRLGDPLQVDTEMGPVANRPQYERILDRIEAAKAEGARVVTGGTAATGAELGDGLFVAPTVFADVTPDMTVAQEEVFGPVLSVIPFEDEKDAVAIANNSAYGLAAGLWTRDIGRAQRVANELRTGVVWVNTYRSTAAQAPFGGVKRSGYGRERGEAALAEYTYVKNIMIDYSDGARDPFSIRT